MPKHRAHHEPPTAHEKAAFKKHWKTSGKTKEQAAKTFRGGKWTVSQFKDVHKHKRKHTTHRKRGGEEGPHHRVHHGRDD